MRYRSTILESDGSTATLDVDAADEQSLHDRLFAEGRMLLRARPLAAEVPVRSVRLSPRRLLLLVQALHGALDAGVPLLTVLQSMAQQEEDGRVAALLQDVGDRIARGATFADALAAHPRSFPPLLIALARAGEHSGQLPDVLDATARHLEWKQEIAGTVRQALLYPVIVLAAGYGLVLFLLSFVVPRLGDVISRMGTELPAASRALISCSGFVAANLPAILLASAAAVVLAVCGARTDRGKAIGMALFLRLPVARAVAATLQLAQFCRTMAVLLHAGLDMTASLELAAAATAGNGARASLHDVRERILRGDRFGEALQAARFLPPVALGMVRVGEDAGRLPFTMTRLGALYDREVKNVVKRALALLEPAVIVLLGLVVGGVAVLVVVTIYSAMRGIGR